MESLKNIIKKISWLLILNLVVTLIAASTRRGLDSIFFDFVPAIFVLFLILPLVSGILLILIQNKNRSYQFLPTLLIGSCLNNIAIVLVLGVAEYFRHGYAYRQFIDIFEMMQLFLPIFGISIFGGLIGLVIRGTSEQFKKYPNSKITIAFRKIFGSLFVGISVLGGLISLIVFLVLSFNPSSPWLNIIMADFRLIEILGVVQYYLLLVSALSIILIPLTFLANWGLKLFLEKKFVNKKLALRLRIYFYVSLVIFSMLSTYITSEFNVKTAEMKANIKESHVDIKDFKNIYISPFVEFDDVIIKQGDNFDIIVKGSEYDRIGLNFEKIGDTLNIKRSELETFFNTDTWTVENRDILFRAGSKHLTIEITMPDIEKIENEGANMVLENLEVDNLEIGLTHRFNNIKGDVEVADTLKLELKGAIINLTGSAKNLVINSGDCWVEMDKFIAEEATINAVNTSRLNVYVTDNMDVRSGVNSGIVNYFDEFEKDLTANNFGNDQIEKAISNYLKIQKHFSWKNRDDSHNFCTIENLKPDKELFPLYVWAYCGEYVIEDGKLKMLSGLSGPAKIDYPNELSFYDLSKFSYEAPRDGTLYSEDIEAIFPEDVQQKISSYDVGRLKARAEDYAFTNISNWNLIKQAIADCEIESVMQTHALEVTTTFKDGRKVTAQEPEIDYIFNIVDQYKEKCGEIRMATE